MALPKEPRQLMINIMYLVLTALLALNVSAKIFNAFKIVDSSIVKSNHSLDLANSALPDAIRDGAKKKSSLAHYAEQITPAQNISKSTNTFIQSIIDELIDKTGNNNGVVDEGDYKTIGGHKVLTGEKNKDVTTRLLADEKKNSKGNEIKERLLEAKASFLQLVDQEDRKTFEKELAIDIDDATWKKDGKYRSWANYTFKQMPVQAVLPILRKFQNDIKSSESSVLKYLANKVGTTTDVVIDRFNVVSAPAKTYVINGEDFETEVFVSASASKESNTGMQLLVNGSTVSVDENGVAKFKQKASGLGIKNYTVTGKISNPVTGEVQTFSKTYEYEVGERSVSVSASKMNVFYIGVDNPIEVSAAGVPSAQVNVTLSGGGGASISRSGNGQYTVKATRPTSTGEFCNIKVTAPGLNASKQFRVKRIPDPVASLNKKIGGALSSGELKVLPGIFLEIPNFDFDAKCTVRGFKFVRVPSREDPEIEINPGASFTGNVQSIINKVKAGDRIFLEDIKCSCPGDGAARDLGTLTYRIK